MICQHDAPRATWHVVPRFSAACPSSFSIQVHFRDAESDGWRVYARFAFPGEAEACLNELRRRGFEARLDGGNLDD